MSDSLLLLILTVCSVSIVLQKDLFKSVILYSVFSLICATLYFIYSAPDVALAEVAVGSAFIPVIFIIAISRQKEFVVVSYVFDDFLSKELPGGKAGTGYELLSRFCSIYDLSLVLCPNEDGKFCGFLKISNVDLFISKSDDGYVIKGKSSSLLMKRLESMLLQYDDIRVEMISDEEIFD